MFIRTQQSIIKKLKQEETSENRPDTRADLTKTQLMIRLSVIHPQKVTPQSVNCLRAFFFADKLLSVAN